MDESINYDEAFSFERTLGIITAWDAITFGKDENLSNGQNLPFGRTAFTVDDIYMMLRKLKRFIDPVNLERIERLIVAHLNDTNNPHKVKIDDLSSSVMNELYHDWLNYKNRVDFDNKYTEDELMQLCPTEQFLKVLFQLITVADVDTTLEGISTSQVVSPAGLKAAIDKHNQDENAHANLMDYLLPGAVHTYAPTFAMIADVGTPDEVTVKRDGYLSYLGPDGKIYKAPSNTLPIDWSTGRPAFPIFDKTYNHCTYSNLTNSVFNKTNVEIIESSYTVGLDSTNTTYRVVPTGDTTLVHKFSYVLTPSMVEDKKSICVSICVHTDLLDNIGINVYQSEYSEFDCWHYNISNEMMYNIPSEMSANVDAKLYRLPNDYVRCVYTRTIEPGKQTTIDFHLLDLFDGDLSFIADEKKGIYMCAPQIEFDTSVPSPYKETNGSIAVEYPTTLYMDIASAYPWYNPVQGGFLWEISTIEDYTVLNTPKYVFDLVLNTSHVSAMSAYYPAVHDSRLATYFAGSTGQMVYQHLFSKNLDKDVYARYGMSFVNAGRKQPVAGDAVILDPTHTLYQLGEKNDFTSKEYLANVGDMASSMYRLYIGCKGPNSYYLNGYLTSLIYYPALVTADHMKFFIKG